LSELIGWLCFAIGGSHVSDGLPRPHRSKHIIREEMLLQVILINDYEAHELNKNINMMCRDKLFTINVAKLKWSILISW